MKIQILLHVKNYMTNNNKAKKNKLNWALILAILHVLMKGMFWFFFCFLFFTVPKQKPGEI